MNKVLFWLPAVLSYLTPETVAILCSVSTKVKKICVLAQVGETSVASAEEQRDITDFVCSFAMGTAKKKAMQELASFFSSCELPLYARGDIISEFKDALCSLYNRSILPPGTNVGTQDTTRTIERLTQARLSRFHNTGGAAQQYVTLDALLHPQATRNGSTIGVHIKEGFDVELIAKRYLLHSQLSDVMQRGKEQYIFLSSNLPPLVKLYFRLSSQHCHCLRIELCVEHCHERMLSPAWVSHTVETGATGLRACCIVMDGRVFLYVLVTTLEGVVVSGDFGYRNLWSRRYTPPEKHLCRGLVPLAVFDTGSSSIVRQLQPPTLSTPEIEALSNLVAMSAKVVDNVPRRTVKTMPSFTTSTAQSRKRYFSGTRRKAKVVGGGQGETANTLLITCLQRVIVWMGHVLHHLNCSVPNNDYIKRLLLETSQCSSHAQCQELLHNWNSFDNEPTDPPPLAAIICCMLSRTCLIVRPITAASGRLETAGAIFNETIFLLFSEYMVRPYLQFQILTKLVFLSLGGIRGIQSVHVDQSVVTAQCGDGACFKAVLSGAVPGVCMQKTCTTSVPDFGDVLGLEAVCALFSNGRLAESLGVSNHSCKFLTDYISSRGVFKGINRSTIVGTNSTLNSITVEDPARHITTSGAFALTDACTGTSANVLLGLPVPCGTSFFTTCYNTEDFSSDANQNVT